jgi:hypothetical protein
VGRLDKSWKETFYPPGQAPAGKETKETKEEPVRESIDTTPAMETSAGPPVAREDLGGAKQVAGEVAA